MSAIDEKTKRDIKNGVPTTILCFDKDGNTTSQESYNLENIKIPDNAMRSFARTILPKVEEFYSDPENVKKFEEWKKSK